MHQVGNMPCLRCNPLVLSSNDQYKSVQNEVLRGLKKERIKLRKKKGKKKETKKKPQKVGVKFEGEGSKKVEIWKKWIHT